MNPHILKPSILCMAGFTKLFFVWHASVFDVSLSLSVSLLLTLWELGLWEGSVYKYRVIILGYLALFVNFSCPFVCLSLHFHHLLVFNSSLLLCVSAFYYFTVYSSFVLLLQSYSLSFMLKFFINIHSFKILYLKGFKCFISILYSS